MKKPVLFFILLTLVIAGYAKSKHTVINYASFNIRYSDGDRKSPVKCWDVRRSRVIGFIRDQDLDILGCQEVLQDQLEDLTAALPEYDYEGVGREDGKQKGEYAPVFWKRAEWSRLDGGTFWLSETPEVVGSKGWDAALPRIASWVLLRNVKSKKKILCINTHFDHIGIKARVESGKLILKKAKEIAGDTPLVLTGDFNVSMDSPVYSSITHDPDYTILDTFLEGAPHTGVFNSFHGFSTNPVDQCGKIDFIFATPDIKVLSTYIHPEDRSQNPKHISDHNPVVAKLQLK